MDSHRTKKADEASARAVVGYALTSNFPMAAVRDSVNEARDIARLDARDVVCLADVRSAIMERQAPSDAAMKKAFATATPRRSRAATAPGSVRPEQLSKVRVSKRAVASLPLRSSPKNALNRPANPKRLGAPAPESDADRAALSAGLCS